MDIHPFDWHDFVRVIAFCVAVYSFVTLINRFRKSGSDWNTKTKDYWYALTMWSLAGSVLTVQSILLDRPFTPGFVFLITGILVTGKGVHNKSDWGSHAA